MTDGPGVATPGWYADPEGRHEHRWWDGATWTDQVADAGVVASAPLGMPTEPVIGGDQTLLDQPTAVVDGPPPLPGPPAEPVPGEGRYVSDQAMADVDAARRLPVAVLVALAVGVAALAALVVLAVGQFTGDDGGDPVSSSSDDASDDLTDDVTSDLTSGFSDDVSSDFSIDLSDDFSIDFSDDFSFDVPAPSDGLELGDPEDPSQFIPEYGTDAEFDALADSCFAGDLADCDQLYAITPIEASTNSYEGYGATCGGRLDEESPGTCITRG